MGDPFSLATKMIQCVQNSGSLLFAFDRNRIDQGQRWIRDHTDPFISISPTDANLRPIFVKAQQAVTYSGIVVPQIKTEPYSGFS